MSLVRLEEHLSRTCFGSFPSFICEESGSSLETVKLSGILSARQHPVINLQLLSLVLKSTSWFLGDFQLLTRPVSRWIACPMFKFLLMLAILLCRVNRNPINFLAFVFNALPTFLHAKLEVVPERKHSEVSFPSTSPPKSPHFTWKVFNLHRNFCWAFY